jgi:phosphatidylglycerophosphate synthase
MIKEKSKTWAKFSAQLGYIFSHLPFRPNYYTWLTLPIAFIGLLAIINRLVISGVLLFLIAGLLDIIDGAVARHTQQASHAGAFLDGSLDRFIDFFLIFSYFWLAIETPWMALSHWITAAIFFAIMPSFEVAYANHRRAVNDPEEKLIWRILNRGEMYILMLLIPLFSLINPKWAGYLLVILVILSVITTLQTLVTTLRLARPKT